MELKDTVELMLSGDYKDRFIAEYCQAYIRVVKLNRMIDDWCNGRLTFEPKSSLETLIEQVHLMSDYVDILDERATQEGIDLPCVL